MALAASRMTQQSKEHDHSAPAASANNGEGLNSTPAPGPIPIPQDQDSDTYPLMKMQHKETEAPEASHRHPEDLGELTGLADEINISKKRLRMGFLFKLVAFAFPLVLACAILIDKGIKAQPEELLVGEEVLPEDKLRPPVGEEVLPEDKLRPPAPPAEVSWSVPPVETAEERASVISQLLRGELVKAVEHVRSEIPVALSDEGAAIVELAKTLTDGTSSELRGRTVTLTDFRAVGPGRLKPGPQRFLITGLVGEGPGSVTVALEAQGTGENFAMRMSMVSALSDSPPQLDESSSIERARQGVLRACGEIPLDTAGPARGVAALHAIASIHGASPVVRGENVGLLSKVQLMEKLQLDLGTFLGAKPLLRTGWKAFLARRCLKTVLHLQRSGLSHNQVSSSNFFFKSDGSIVLSGFDSSIPFGEAIAPDVDFPAVTTDPAVLLALSHDEGSPVLAGPESDLWSLGVLLYEIMMEGKLPYNLSSLKEVDDPVPQLLDLGRHADPLVLNDEMASARISRRWRKLILRLLEPDQQKRISSQEIAAEFQDLLNGEIEIEVFDANNDAEFYGGELPED